jgi:5-methyltetrahydrofolate--homocysteine methyltransferase
MPRQEHTRLLEELLAERILVLDGAMGTAIQARHLTAEDFGGPQLEGCNENLVLTRPDVVLDIHRGYLEVGADIIETNTFGGTPIVLAEYGLQDQVHQLNETAARLAKQAATELSTTNRPRFVAGSMGPTTKAISVTGGVTFDQLINGFRDQAAGLVAGGADILIVETQQDTRNVKAALIGIWRLFDELGFKVPVMVSGTIEAMGTMLAGQTVEAFSTSVMHADCCRWVELRDRPEFMTDHPKLAGLTETVSRVYQRGFTNEDGIYLETRTSATIERFVDHGWINCRRMLWYTAHIARLAQMVEGKRPRVPKTPSNPVLGIDFVEASDDQRPLIVGERTNEVGSRKFKRLITEEKYEEAAEIARQQVKGGAQICDVNLQNADREELYDVDRFYEKMIRVVKAPTMIDTTDPIAIERALTYCQGKSIINSINLEDGLDNSTGDASLRANTRGAYRGCIDE